MFQNRLFEAFRAIDPLNYVFIEGESKRMGKVMLPSNLHDTMKEGFKIEITAPLPQRVERILKDYYAIDDTFFYTNGNYHTLY